MSEKGGGAKSPLSRATAAVAPHGPAALLEGLNFEPSEAFWKQFWDPSSSGVRFLANSCKWSTV